MKKIISLTLVALMLTASAVMAMADVDPSFTASEATATTGLSIDTTGEDGTLEGALLTPGKEYDFPLLLDGQPITDDTLKDVNIRISAKKGSSTMSSFSLVKVSGRHVLRAIVKTAWPVNPTDVEYEIRLIDRKDQPGVTLDTLTVRFETGYRAADDAIINSLSIGDEIVVDPEAPVFTKDQLNKISSVNNYRNVTFVGDIWRYTVNVTDLKGINMLYNYNGIPELLSKYQEHDFEFINFPAGPTFTINGKFEIDVADFADNFEGKFYVYRYLSGRLTQHNTTYDEENNTLTFNTNTLGRFVLSDRPMDASIIDNNTSSGGTQPTVPGGNPVTGAVA